MSLNLYRVLVVAHFICFILANLAQSTDFLMGEDWLQFTISGSAQEPLEPGEAVIVGVVGLVFLIAMLMTYIGMFLFHRWARFVLLLLTAIQLVLGLLGGAQLVAMYFVVLIAWSYYALFTGFMIAVCYLDSNVAARFMRVPGTHPTPSPPSS